MHNDISAERARQLLDYNPDSGLLTWKISPANNVVAGAPAGCKNRRGYIYVSILGRKYKAHRLAWLITHGEWPEIFLDHIDGNKINNRIGNLRQVTETQNQANRPCRGYSFNRQSGRYTSEISVNGRKKYLGLFDTSAEARAAYVAAHLEAHGKFSFLNRELSPAPDAE